MTFIRESQEVWVVEIQVREHKRGWIPAGPHVGAAAPHAGCEPQDDEWIPSDRHFSSKEKAQKWLDQFEPFFHLRVRRYVPDETEVLNRTVVY
jgi:hypothetical protein